MRLMRFVLVLAGVLLIPVPGLSEPSRDYGHPLNGSTLEDLRRFTLCDGQGTDTILEIWARLPVRVHVEPYAYSYFGSSINYEDVFWSAVATVEEEVGALLGLSVDLYSPSASGGADLSVDETAPMTWAQFETFDWSRSGAPAFARLHLRNYTTADTLDLEAEIEHALLWLLIGGDGNLPWPNPTRRFRTQTVDLSNMDIVEGPPTAADYEMLALALTLGDGADLEELRDSANRAPRIIVQAPEDTLAPGTAIVVNASGTYDPDGDEFTLALEQVQGFDQAAIAAQDGGLFTVLLPASGDYVFELAATDPLGNVATRRLHLYALAPCPEPRPLATKDGMIVAAHYMTTWGSKNNDWRTGSENVGDRSYDFTFGSPRYHSLLGNYDTADPRVADWHVKMAVENGINCFIIPDTRPASDWGGVANLPDGLLRSQYLHDIRFCMELNTTPWWTPDGYFGGITLSELVEETVSYYCDHYFSNPQYLRIGGRPVLMLYREQVHYAVSGKEARDQYVRQILDVATRHGYDLYLVGDVLGDNYNPAWLKGIVEAFDCVSAYWTTGVPWSFRQGIPYVDVSFAQNASSVLAQFELYNGFLGASGASLAPAIAVGFDNTPAFEIGKDNWLWKQSVATPSQFANLAESALEYVDGSSRMLVLYAWNEYHEGGVLEPTHENGYTYLEALRDVVAVEPEAGWPSNSAP
jgi:hypothetical protein